MHRVVIIGSGFGGLFAAKALKHADVDITLIAKTNTHLFQPLLYQVATGVLSEGEIAPPTREILRRQKNVQVLLGLVEDIDLTARTVKWRFHNQHHETPYDTLIVAAGAGQSYFGNDHFRTFAPGMKTIDDALELRARILKSFEVAEFTTDPDERRRLLTFAVVGAGPTGVEMAGQIRELADSTLRNEFRSFDPSDARVVLLDGADQVLPPFGPRLGRNAQETLEKQGVEVQLGAIVTDLDDDGLTFRRKDGSTQRIEAGCKVWAAGVQGSELGATLAEQSDAQLDRSGRVVVDEKLNLPGHPEVFVIGDMASMPGVPGVAQGAIQGAKHAAKTIRARVANAPEPGAFTYRDKGSMATISKFAAVTQIGKIQLTGFIAWLAWLFLHLLYIAGFKQRITTLLSWFITFVTNGRSQRVVTNQQMVARLALERLGAGSSGKLIHGEELTED
ncbi:NAD(P)/FAD-dependent oxidoreductase [Tessaracoccus sp. MC1865]|uniref:NAD(P)/FAD-dependent oxidoreductase n=1 Tax=Tessaracoccus sp. MC1865 TaxID=2760310 RepID=UPI001602998E|nr:NAD(P)/FAD-dependent oxidoreductase [Tessaracoccus sp. MC1865]MBB1482729.1 NAD(P)/FAD-dependent oxidoreductase [Tessaracoccus sp. MC1865]QTO37822.1 NAD(P)/FAD-dependent oxidoreductase [Tessaracoccus sp. MC1865]